MHSFYDGIDYRYSSSDADTSKAIEIVSNVLGFRPNSDGLQYSLRLYAGGSGVDDRLAIRFVLDASSWPILCEKCRLKSPDEAMASVGWSEGFEWLIRGEATANDLLSDVREFIDTNRHSFQDRTSSSATIAFSNESDVNSWCVVWTADGWVNYLSFDQG